MDVGVLFNVTDLVREIDMEKKAIEGFVKEVAEFSIPIIDIPIVNTAGRQVPRYINPFARTQKDLDSLLNIFSKSKHNKEIAEGLIERAKGELAKLRNDPPAGGPRLHHKAEIKAMLDRAKRIIERLKGKAKEEFEKHIKEVEDEAGKH